MKIKLSNNHTTALVMSAMFLALALILPLVTMQLPEMGNALCPMHFPVLLCGFVCGPVYAAGVGLIAPILRFALFGMPEIFPRGVVMCLELATYGAVSGVLYNILPKNTKNIYISLVGAMLAGRVVWGIAKTVLYGMGKIKFGWMMFLSGGFIEAIPGIIIQILLIPGIVKGLVQRDYFS